MFRDYVIRLFSFSFLLSVLLYMIADNQEAYTMKLIITAGTQGRNTVLDIHKDASVEELFRKISEWNGIAAESQRVIFADWVADINK
ncbi:hypothetical protein KUTeg_009912 [Tegillarca granosa]|uniref:Uncharacterized protein n=1 Tax=Tegillarca granosa TaxID=220873 RepID=A0ABQ9F5C8_TEGGR|nr:hypothetical protein KUTeg_009912 [Tegillarca granosa]